MATGTRPDAEDTFGTLRQRADQGAIEILVEQALVLTGIYRAMTVGWLMSAEEASFRKASRVLAFSILRRAFQPFLIRPTSAAVSSRVLALPPRSPV
jgi:hypothetical protein